MSDSIAHFRLAIAAVGLAPTDTINANAAKDRQPVASRRNGVILISGSDLTPEAVRWLWHEWLALGKLHILAGAPGQGKTTIAIAFAATITSGGHWPDGSRCEPGVECQPELTP